VKATREVILSAGSFETPKLLMLSGVGPSSHLRKFGIDVLKHLPVGETLYDHVGVLGPIYTVNKNLDPLLTFEVLPEINAHLDFFAGKGPLTTNGIESVLFLKTNISKSPDPDYPDIEVMEAFSSVAFDTGPGLNLSFRLTGTTYDAVFRPLLSQRTFQFLPTLLHPRSKGHLKLRSTNPSDKPLLYGNFFDDDHDLETLVAGIKETIRIADQLPFQKMGAKLAEIVVPGCENYPFNTHNYWRCYARHLTTTFHHQVGTCKMGPASDPTTVVDHKLRVHGIKKLRVADTGIIPFPPTGHTSSYSFLIGERLADFIKEEWNET
jgi:choline dehydrogenase-like flavoprotein